jgi:hypothetical protein
MITELQAMIEMFRQATAKLYNITMPIARRFGYPEEMEAKAMMELLAEMNSKQNPWTQHEKRVTGRQIGRQHWPNLRHFDSQSWCPPPWQASAPLSLGVGRLGAPECE